MGPPEEAMELMNELAKRIQSLLVILGCSLVFGLLITYQVIHIDWISFMEIQPSFRPMENPLPHRRFSAG